jgi:uncharacterized membrane protein YfcA
MLELSPWIYAATGAVTGILGATLGLGGGIFLVPVLTLVFDIPFRTAVAASLISVIATASVASTVNLGRGLVNFRLGMTLEIATTIGGLTGGFLAALLTQRQLFSIFGLTLAGMGVIMALRSGRRNVIAGAGVEPGLLGGQLEEDDRIYVYRLRRTPLALGASLLAGSISGLLGLGGGIIKIPILTAFCGIPIKVAAATSAFMIGVTAAASAFVYYGRGDIDLALAAAIALGALPGSLAGARLGHALEARSLKLFLAVVLFVVGGQMAIKALRLG